MLNSKEFVRELQLRHESAWMNPNVGSAETALAALPLTRTDIDDAEARLERFAPFIKKVFPETAADRGLIESPLTEIENMRAWLNENEDAQFAGKLFLKRDSDLPVAGSVKARGGCYAVLKHTEDLALANRLVEMRDDYSVFATRAFRNFFSQYELHVGRAAVEKGPAARKGRDGARIRRGLLLRRAEGPRARGGGPEKLFYRR